MTWIEVQSIDTTIEVRRMVNNSLGGFYLYHIVSDGRGNKILMSHYTEQGMDQ